MRNWITLALLLAVGSAHALSVTIFMNTPVICTYPTGEITASVSGGIPPYTYAWGGGESTGSLTGLVAGSYSVTVTDNVGTQATDQIDLVAENYYPLSDYAHTYCAGQQYMAMFIPYSPFNPSYDPSFGPYTSTGGDPIDVSLGGNEGYFAIPAGVADGQPFTITYWDVNGCPGELSGVAGYEVEWPEFSILSVEGSCANVATGSVSFATTGEGHEQTLWYHLLDDNGVPVGYPPQVTGLPGTYMIDQLSPGSHHLTVSTQNTPSLFQGGFCYAPDTIDFVVPDLGPVCGQVSGDLFMDYDGDCALDANEPQVPNVVVEIQPGPVYVGASYGHYSAVLDYGSYTLSTTAAAVAQSCPAAVTLDAGNITPTVNIGHAPTIPMDVSIGMGSTAARPGFEWDVSIAVFNHSPANTGTITVTMVFDATVGYLAAQPAPTSVNGSIITWVQPALGFFGHQHFHVQLQVPPVVTLIGTQLFASATVNTQLTDGSMVNNSDALSVTITGSVDPNEKIVSTEEEIPGIYVIGEDDWIDYTIRFQNTGTDTAFSIVVTDTLPAALDPLSFEVQAVSHEVDWTMSGPGILRFMFPLILLPDSNVNEAASHGFVSFRIKPKQPVLPGTVIENIANIFFDFNDPVITEPSVLTAEFSTQVDHPSTGSGRQLVVAPNPASDQLRITADGTIDAITILATDGREMLRRSVRSSNAMLDVSGLRAGSYFILSTLDDGNVVRERFIKL